MRGSLWVMTCLVVIASCGKTNDGRGSASANAKKESAPTGSAGGVVTVGIKNMQFGDGKPVAITTGQSVQWVNEEQNGCVHTITSNDVHDSDANDTGRGYSPGYMHPGQKSEPVTFLAPSPKDGFGYHCEVHDEMKHGSVIVTGSTVPSTPPGDAPTFVPPAHHECEMPMQHSMYITGSNPRGFYLHHVAIFNDPDHTYQVLLVGALHGADAKAQQTLEAAFTAHCTNGKHCLINPANFVLGNLHDGMSSMTADFSESFSNPNTFPDLKGVNVEVVRIIQFRSFDPKAQRPDRLVYQLYGDGNEIFMTHQMSEAPDYQEVVSLVPGPTITPDLLKQSPLVKVLSKKLETTTLTLKAARFNDGRYLLLAPPEQPSNAVPVLQNGEQLDVLIGNDKTVHQVTVDKVIWFDTKNLNQ